MGVVPAGPPSTDASKPSSPAQSSIDGTFPLPSESDSPPAAPISSVASENNLPEMAASGVISAESAAGKAEDEGDGDSASDLGSDQLRWSGTVERINVCYPSRNMHSSIIRSCYGVSVLLCVHEYTVPVTIAMHCRSQHGHAWLEMRVLTRAYASCLCISCRSNLCSFRAHYPLAGSTLDHAGTHWTPIHFLCL
jgi:hypothetical protein